MNVRATVPGQSSQQHLNFGVLELHRDAAPQASPDEPITIIVSGVGRSGTSMTASVISALGVPMGQTGNQAVFEDKDFIAALLYFNYDLMLTLIRQRDAAEPRWGFKFPSLQNHLLPPQIERFRNPHLIVVMRDLVAVASRSSMSDLEQSGDVEALLNVSKQTYDMAHFVEKVRCPVLLLSYEKFIAFPEMAIGAIAKFCGITMDENKRGRAMLAVEPNNPEYIKLFHNDHRGDFNGVRNDTALGWCCHNNLPEPVEVELLADGVVVASARADVFRQDLKVAGIGSGQHSFHIDLKGLALNDATVLRVQTKGGGFVLDGSDVPLAQLRKVKHEQADKTAVNGT